MAQEANATLNLPNPWPSSPKHPPRFNVKIEGPNGYLVTGFREMYAFKYLVHLIIDDREWKWKNDTTIFCDDGTTIISDHLEQCVEYKLTSTERKWVPPAPYFSEWQQLATGRPQDSSRARQKPSTPSNSSEPKPKAERAQRAPQASREGLVELATIAQQLGLEPKACRVALRKSGIEKPAAGWAWPASQVDQVKATIKKHAK